MKDRIKVYADTELTHKAWLICRGGYHPPAILQTHRADSTCFPSIKTISRDANLSESSVKRSLNELLKRNYIAKEHRFRSNGGKSSNLYHIL